MKNPIKLTTIIIIIIGFIKLSSAEYSVMIPLEQDKGGNLPNGSIDLGTVTPEPPVVPTANWIQISSIVNDWIDDGVVYECGEWLPASHTVRLNEFFLQSANNCKQNQYRTVQEREQNSITNEIRNKGSLINENRTLTNVVGERDAYGILDCVYDPVVLNYWTQNTSEWEIFFEDIYVGSSGQFGGINVQTISYNGYNLSKGNLMEGNNYEICKYIPN